MNIFEDDDEHEFWIKVGNSYRNSYYDESCSLSDIFNFIRKDDKIKTVYDIDENNIKQLKIQK